MSSSFHGRRPKPVNLYKRFYQQNPECVRGNLTDDCWKDPMQMEDYNCRYRRRGNCLCCGILNHYIEVGEVCSRFCNSRESSCPEFENGTGCCETIINLPLNHGEPPEKMECDEKE